MVTASRILGDEVGSTAPAFLAVLAVHVVAGLTAVITGAAAAAGPQGQSPAHPGRPLVLPGHHRRVRHRDRPGRNALGPGLVPVRPRRGGVHRRHRRVPAPPPPPPRRHRAHRRDGHRLHRHAHRVLRRQRAAPAAVGPAAQSWRSGSCPPPSPRPSSPARSSAPGIHRPVTGTEGRPDRTISRQGPDRRHWVQLAAARRGARPWTRWLRSDIAASKLARSPAGIGSGADQCTAPCSRRPSMPGPCSRRGRKYPFRCAGCRQETALP